jgi:hypothetical protein
VFDFLLFKIQHKSKANPTQMHRVNTQLITIAAMTPPLKPSNGDNGKYVVIVVDGYDVDFEVEYGFCIQSRK